MRALFNEIDEDKLTENISARVRALRKLYVYIDELKNKIDSSLELGVDASSHEIIFLIRQVSAEIYSCCEIVNELFISLYREDIRYRGSVLSNGYNSNFKKIYKSHIDRCKLKGVYGDNYVDKFYYDSKDWYVILHDIRTQETHYDLGELIKENDKIIYINKNRNGISKQIYTNYTDEINLEVKEFLCLIEKFLKSANDIVTKLKV